RPGGPRRRRGRLPGCVPVRPPAVRPAPGRPTAHLAAPRVVGRGPRPLQDHRVGTAPGPPPPPGTTLNRPRLLHATPPAWRAVRVAAYRVLPAPARGDYVARLEADGIGHVALEHATRASAPGQDVLLLKELLSVFRRLRPDIVHTHNPKPGVLGRLAAKAARVPLIVNTCHGLYALPPDPWPKRAAVYAAEWLAATCSDAELVQNPEDLETLTRLRVRRAKLHLLGNGIDLARFD